MIVQGGKARGGEADAVLGGAQHRQGRARAELPIRRPRDAKDVEVGVVELALQLALIPPVAAQNPRVLGVDLGLNPAKLAVELAEVVVELGPHANRRGVGEVDGGVDQKPQVFHVGVDVLEGGDELVRQQLRALAVVGFEDSDRLRDEVDKGQEARGVLEREAAALELAIQPIHVPTPLEDLVDQHIA
ncbi:unnamed protein product [Phytomonas sp. Hart1]|nr:unnamed protein product [Phytomonas sp. Hart1]|eukprot:CCW66151.1 unnamed protein product [Phytomonas sp. isolate Hart1]